MKVHPIQTGSVVIHERQRVGADGPLRLLPSHDPAAPARLQALG